MIHTMRFLIYVKARALKSNWGKLAMKAGPLLEPRDIGRPNLGIIFIINFLATTWAISTWDRKASTQTVMV